MSSPPSSEGIVTVGLYYEVKPGKAEAFIAKFEEVVAALRQGPGHRESHLYRRVDDADSFAILSEWDSREAFLSFLKSEAFAAVTRWGLGEALRSRPRHRIYPRVESLDRPGA
jgi:heme-degrading monooxygenase HmoA